MDGYEDEPMGDDDIPEDDVGGDPEEDEDDDGGDEAAVQGGVEILESSDAAMATPANERVTTRWGLIDRSIHTLFILH